MKGDSLETVSFQRILIALDTSAHGLAALDAAASLAPDLSAELHGLFIEDESLFRLAGLPFAQEILYSSAVQRHLDLASVQRICRGRAEVLRRQLVQRAERLRAKWSFQVARGRIVELALAAASDADLLLVARENPSPPTQARPLSERRPLLVVYDEAPARFHTLLAAGRLVQGQRPDVIVLIVAEDPPTLERLATECTQRLLEYGLAALVQKCCITSGQQLVDVARRRHARLLLLSRDSRLLDAATLEKLVDQADCPVGLVR